MLCYAMLCYAMLCYAMLCYVRSARVAAMVHLDKVHAPVRGACDWVRVTTRR
jgi:hypothetical protein